MKYLELPVNGKILKLRLTTLKLQNYIKANGDRSASPLLSVLDAMESLEKEAALLTAALSWPGTENTNAIKDGYQLLDELADDGKSTTDVKELILRLAVDAGLLAEEDGQALIDSLKPGNDKMIATMSQVLRLERPDLADSAEPAEASEANPT